ncbi:MAG: hypothetical protein HY858_04180 [Candidatus Solibacter usitatus]|nr:hypothetical protein [Candidatus Solibacter usitatus]
MSFVLAAQDAPPSPELVLQQALEAQARGDLDALFSYAALDLFPEKNVAVARQVFGALRENVSLSNFVFVEHGVCYSEQGNVALVRAEVSFTLDGPGGYSTADSNGITAVLVLRDGQWKIVRLNPDSLIDQMLLDGERDAAQTPAAAIGRAAYPAPRPAALTPRQANQMLKLMLKTDHFDEKTFLKDLGEVLVGEVPLVGDAAAMIASAVELGINTKEFVEEVTSNGVSGIALGKATQMALGAVQIITEPIPGVDAMADAVSMFASQATFDAEVKRAARGLMASLRDEFRRFNPLLYPLPKALYKYPDGVEFVYATAEEAPPRAFGPPLKRIVLGKGRVVSAKLPFVVIGELQIEEALAKAIAKLGAREAGGKFYFPMNLSAQVMKPGDSAAFVNDGDSTVAYLGRTSSVKGAAASVVLQPGCEPGLAKFFLQLGIGEATEPVEAENRVINQITRLVIAGVPETGLTLAPAEKRDSLKVMGASDSLPSADWPELTRLKGCFSVFVADTAIATVEQPLTLTVTGVKEGKTALTLVRPAAIFTTSVGEVSSDIPVTVGVDAAGLIPKIGRYVALVLRGNHTCADENGRTMKCSDIEGHVSGAIVIDTWNMKFNTWDQLRYSVTAQTSGAWQTAITAAGEVTLLSIGSAPGPFASGAFTKNITWSTADGRTLSMSFQVDPLQLTGEVTASSNLVRFTGPASAVRAYDLKYFQPKAISGKDSNWKISKFDTAGTVEIIFYRSVPWY